MNRNFTVAKPILKFLIYCYLLLFGFEELNGFAWALFLLILSFSFIFYVSKDLLPRNLVISEVEDPGNFQADTSPALYNFILIVFIAFCIALHLKYYVFEIVEVEHNSMVPTLAPKQKIVIEKFSNGIIYPPFVSDDFTKEKFYARKRLMRFRKLKHQDIIVFYPPGKQGTLLYVKRIIGLPGDHIVLKKGNVFRNSIKLNESYLKPGTETENLTVNRIEDVIPFLIKTKGTYSKKAFMNGPGIDFVVPQNTFYVLGDNRQSSVDSRNWGFLPQEYILGRVIYY